jgi:tetratricopeptide (TPR) repeat protein
LQDEVLTPVAAAFELSWVQLNAAEQQLAVLLSVFALAPMPWQLVESVVVVCRVEAPKQNWLKKLLAVWGKVQAPQQWCLLLDDRVLSQSRRRLVELSLLGRVEQKQYQLHALIREFFAAKLQGRADAEILRRSFAAALTAVAKTIPQIVTLKVQEWVKEALPHLEVVAEQWSHLLEDSTDAMGSFTVLAWVAQGQSLWAEAEKWLKACLQMTKKRSGTDHPNTATSLNNLALLYHAMGRYAEAEPLLVQSLSIWEQQLGANHPNTATSLNNLAGLYHAMGRYPEAEPLLMRSLSISEQQLGANHPHTASSLNNLAALYRAMGRYAEAEPLLVRSLSIWKQQFGADHPDTATSLNNLAGIYGVMGRYPEAESLFVRSLSIRQQQLGADHPETGTSLSNLAGLYKSMGRYPEAEPLYLEALEIFLNRLRENHPNTQTVRRNFIDCLREAMSAGQDSQLSQHPTTQALLQQLRETE